MSSDNITPPGIIPPQISPERIDQLADEAFEGYMLDKNDDFNLAFGQAVAAEINRQWEEMLEPMPIQAGPLNGLYRIKKQG